jgi:hypothetical protein
MSGRCSVPFCRLRQHFVVDVVALAKVRMAVPFFFSAPKLWSALQFCWTGNDKLLANEYYANTNANANTQAIESSPQFYARMRVSLEAERVWTSQTGAT